MNLKEIRDDVRSLIIEPQPGFRSNEELNRWINQAHQELAMNYRLDAKQDLPIKLGMTFYDLPDDVLTLKGAWTKDGHSIPVIPVTSGADLVNEDDDDEKITIFSLQDTLVIIPAPDASLADTSITLFYERKPKQLIRDADIPEIPEPYHRYLVAYATMRALEKDEDYEASAVYQEEYLQGRALIASQRVPLSKDADRILQLVQAGILNAAEAAEWLNVPLKKKIWNRVEVEEKGMALMQTGVISKSDLIDRTVFPDKDEIEKRLSHTASELIPLPNWGDDIDGE